MEFVDFDDFVFCADDFWIFSYSNFKRLRSEVPRKKSFVGFVNYSYCSLCSAPFCDCVAFLIKKWKKKNKEKHDEDETTES